MILSGLLVFPTFGPSIFLLSHVPRSSPYAEDAYVDIALEKTGDDNAFSLCSDATDLTTVSDDVTLADTDVVADHCKDLSCSFVATSWSPAAVITAAVRDGPKTAERKMRKVVAGDRIWWGTKEPQPARGNVVAAGDGIWW
jgi:hypothetical protein